MDSIKQVVGKCFYQWGDLKEGKNAGKVYIVALTTVVAFSASLSHISQKISRFSRLTGIIVGGVASAIFIKYVRSDSFMHLKENLMSEIVTKKLEQVLKTEDAKELDLISHIDIFVRSCPRFDFVNFFSNLNLEKCSDSLLNRLIESLIKYYKTAYPTKDKEQTKTLLKRWIEQTMERAHKALVAVEILDNFNQETVQLRQKAEEGLREAFKCLGEAFKCLDSWPKDSRVRLSITYPDVSSIRFASNMRIIHQLILKYKGITLCNRREYSILGDVKRWCENNFKRFILKGNTDELKCLLDILGESPDFDLLDFLSRIELNACTSGKVDVLLNALQNYMVKEKEKREPKDGSRPLLGSFDARQDLIKWKKSNLKTVLSQLVYNPIKTAFSNANDGVLLAFLNKLDFFNTYEIYLFDWWPGDLKELDLGKYPKFSAELILKVMQLCDLSSTAERAREVLEVWAETAQNKIQDWVLVKGVSMLHTVSFFHLPFKFTRCVLQSSVVKSLSFEEKFALIQSALNQRSSGYSYSFDSYIVLFKHAEALADGDKSTFTRFITEWFKQDLSDIRVGSWSKWNNNEFVICSTAWFFDNPDYRKICLMAAIGKGLVDPSCLFQDYKREKDETVTGNIYLYIGLQKQFSDEEIEGIIQACNNLVYDETINWLPIKKSFIFGIIKYAVIAEDINTIRIIANLDAVRSCVKDEIKRADRIYFSGDLGSLEEKLKELLNSKDPSLCTRFFA